jgi:hypothetical protein
MKPAAEIQAERLRAALTEACCDDCGAMSKKTGKKVCCSPDKKSKDQASDLAVGPASEAGQDVPVRIEEKQRPTTHPFVKRCVAAITKDDPEVERSELSRAFAICTAQMKKSPQAAKAKKKEGVSHERMADYERALADARAKKQEKETK